MNLLFNCYESIEILVYEYSLHRDYKTLNYILVASVFLDEVYQTVRIKVGTELASSYYLNFFYKWEYKYLKKACD